MSDTSTLEVFILDKSYRISCTADDQAILRASAAYLDKKMREVRGQGRILGLERIAVIVALNLSRELLTLQEEQPSPVTPQALERLLARMDQALSAVRHVPMA